MQNVYTQNGILPTGYAYQQSQNPTNQSVDQKHEGIIHRVMVRLGLVVDTANIKKSPDNFLANQPLNTKSERGLQGLQGGGRHLADRASDEQLLIALNNL